jgi:hypothetical protein
MDWQVALSLPVPPESPAISEQLVLKIDEVLIAIDWLVSYLPLEVAESLRAITAEPILVPPELLDWLVELSLPGPVSVPAPETAQPPYLDIQEVLVFGWSADLVLPGQVEVPVAEAILPLQEILIAGWGADVVLPESIETPAPETVTPLQEIIIAGWEAALSVPGAPELPHAETVNPLLEILTSDWLAEVTLSPHPETPSVAPSDVIRQQEQVAVVIDWLSDYTILLAALQMPPQQIAEIVEGILVEVVAVEVELVMPLVLRIASAKMRLRLKQ